VRLFSSVGEQFVRREFVLVLHPAERERNRKPDNGNWELQNLYSATDIIRVVTPGRMRYLGHAARTRDEKFIQNPFPRNWRHDTTWYKTTLKLTWRCRLYVKGSNVYFHVKTQTAYKTHLC
jgi:hypothetical protein